MNLDIQAPISQAICPFSSSLRLAFPTHPHTFFSLLIHAVWLPLLLLPSFVAWVCLLGVSGWPFFGCLLDSGFLPNPSWICLLVLDRFLDLTLLVITYSVRLFTFTLLNHWTVPALLQVFAFWASCDRDGKWTNATLRRNASQIVRGGWIAHKIMGKCDYSYN